MDIIATLVENLTADQLQEIVNAVVAKNQSDKSDDSSPDNSYYDMTEAVPVKFKASLAASEKSRDTSYAERFDHVWCKGSYRVRGPKGGVYFVGRCVMGVRKGQQVKGTLRVSNRHFESLMEGNVIDGWFRPDGQKESVLIGELSNYSPVE